MKSTDATMVLELLKKCFSVHWLSVLSHGKQKIFTSFDFIFNVPNHHLQVRLLKTFKIHNNVGKFFKRCLKYEWLVKIFSLNSNSPC